MLPPLSCVGLVCKKLALAALYYVGKIFPNQVSLEREVARSDRRSRESFCKCVAKLLSEDRAYTSSVFCKENQCWWQSPRMLTSWNLDEEIETVSKRFETDFDFVLR